MVYTVGKAMSLLGFIYEKDQNIFLFSKPGQTGSEVLQTYSTGIGVLYQGGKTDGA
jgi:hypothetical protein